MKILIIIVTYNGESYIEKCLSDIASNDIFEIIIVDNHSKDNTIPLLKSKYPQISIIENKENIGFGQANNIGLAHALTRKFEYVLLLNQDTFINGSTIMDLMVEMENNKSYGILSPIHYITENQIQPIFHKLIENKLLIKDLKKNYFTKKIYRVPFINAAIWLMSKECIEKVGGFSPVFFHYGEDNNYCHRMKYHDIKIGIVSNLRAYHFDNGNVERYYNGKIVIKILNTLKIIYSNPKNSTLINLDMVKLVFQIIYYILKFKLTIFSFFVLIKSILYLDLKNMKICKEKSMDTISPFIY